MNEIIKTTLCFPLIIILILGVSLFLIKSEFVVAEESINLVRDKIESNDNVVRWSHPLNQFEDGRIYLDENGIAFYDYGQKSGEYIGNQRNPVIIYRVSNVFYNDFLENGNETSKKLFMNNADWFIENTVKHGNYSIFEFSYKHVNYQLPIGWHDAMGQGRIINIMLKAHNLTNDNKYLEEAKLLSNAYFVEVSNGGLTYKNNNNGWWYEHFAHKDGLNPRVLNGMMFTMQDIYYLYNYTNDADAKFLFDQGIISLKNDLPFYDFFGYSYYDSLKGSTNYNYQKIHVEKSKWLYDITGEEIFLEYYDKWKSCEQTCHFILKHVALLLREMEQVKQNLISESLLFIHTYHYMYLNQHTQDSLYRIT